VSGFVNYKKGCTRLAAASDRVYQLLVHGRWFSPGTPASSTTKTGHHDIAEILLKVVLNIKNQLNRNQNFNLLVWIKNLEFILYIHFFVYINLHKNWKIYWPKQSFAGLGPEDRCSSWGLHWNVYILLNMYMMLQAFGNISKNHTKYYSTISFSKCMYIIYVYFYFYLAEW
jgi:hypothetical protein